MAAETRCASAELNDWLTRVLRPTFAGRVLPVTEDILLKWRRLLMEDGRMIGILIHTLTLYLQRQPFITDSRLLRATGVISIKREVEVFNPWEQ